MLMKFMTRPGMTTTTTRVTSLRSSQSLAFFFSSRRRHTRCLSDWSSDVCSSDLWSKAIREAVVEREMPPWYADPHTSTLKFSNDRRLSQKEIETIVAWVDAGAPKGEIGRASCRERAGKTEVVGWCGRRSGKRLRA